MKTILTDTQGNVSSMRISFLATVGTACVVAILVVILAPEHIAASAAMIGALLVPAFGGKSFQAHSGY